MVVDCIQGRGVCLELVKGEAVYTVVLTNKLNHTVYTFINETGARKKMNKLREQLGELFRKGDA